MADKNLAADTAQDVSASPHDGTEQPCGLSDLSSPFTFKFESPLTNAVALSFSDHAASRPLTRTGCLRSMARLSENKRRFRSKYGYPLRLIRHTAPRRVFTKSFNVQPVGEGQIIHGGANGAAEEEEEYSDGDGDEEGEEEEDSDYDYDDDDGKKGFDINVAQQLLARLAAARPDINTESPSFRSLLSYVSGGRMQ